MLQDLDARGGAQAGRGNVPQMRPVSAGSQTGRAKMAAGAGLAVVLLAAGGWLGWRYLQRPPALTSGTAPFAAPAAAMPTQAAVNAGPPNAQGGAVQADAAAVHAAPGHAAVAAQPAAATPGAANGAAKGQAAQPNTARLLAVARPIPVAPAAVPADAGDATANFTRRPQRTQAEEKSAAQLAAELKAARKQARQAKAEAERLAAGGRAAERAAAGTAAAARTVKADGKPVRGADIAIQPGTGGVTVTSQQQGENAYRRGLAALQEGRVQEALANMEQAVFLYPRHDTARQTLVGLLIENKRHEEAMRHLQFGLGLDPKQPQMAMILARLQIEKGGPAIETLQRSLPYAAGNGDYLAFLAGALQRAQRNREAAEQYQAALRLQPQNGVWWMGLGISLLAEKRNAEAQEAFTRARNSGNLSQELQSFVERKLQQLAR
ncbi:hypothetical protein ASD15_27600 [Massilia sp. Root351]|nr:hypothetical protein ASD15_27600 [Massilia sp. Root351]